MEDAKTAVYAILQQMQRDESIANLRARKAEADAEWERQQAEYRARSAAKSPEPWIVEELVEELVALDSVALDGVEEDWLFEYMQGIAAQHNRTCGRRDFEMARRLAIPRQRADNERRERLARAQAAAPPSGTAPAPVPVSAAAVAAMRSWTRSSR